MSTNGSKLDEDSEYEHHDMDIEFVDPDELKIDDVNERKRNPGPRTDEGDLEQSIKENGVENPPQARPTEDGDGFRVFAGQRRVQAAQTVGLDEIPIIVKELDDMEALAASVNENNEHLKKDVPRKDRAAAIKELRKEWPLDSVADHFGVEPQTVRIWLEPTRDFWTDTIFDPDRDTDLDTEYIADDLLTDIRRVTGDSGIAEEIAKKVIKNSVPPNVVRRAAEITDNPENFWQEIKDQWEAIAANKTRVSPRITLTGTEADILEEEARTRGLNEKEAAKKLLVERLEQIEKSGPIGRTLIEDSLADRLDAISDRHEISDEELLNRVIEKWLYYADSLDSDLLGVFDEDDT